MAERMVDALVTDLLPEVLADRDLGDGRTFTQMHLRRLWALSCLYAGECVDQDVLVEHVSMHLPTHISLVLSREVAA